MDYASVWEDNLDYGTWIMALDQKGWEELLGGLWHLALEIGKC